MSEGKGKNHPLFTCGRLFAEIRNYAQYAASHRNGPESLQKALSAIEMISHEGGDMARCLVTTVPGKAPQGRECPLCEVDDFVHHAQTAQPSPGIHLTPAFSADPVVRIEPSWLHHALRAALLHALRLLRQGEKVTATVKIDEEEEIAGMVAGETTYGFIKKPFNISEIRSLVERISAEVA
jgi:hypothetical protein